MRNVIVPRVPGPLGVGFGSVPEEPVPVFGMPAPTSFPSVTRPRASTWADTSKFTLVEPLPCTMAEKLAESNVLVSVCDFCV